MTFIELIDTFTYYGIDVALLGLVTAALTQVLKLTVLKNVQKKLITFLPFLLGTLLFAIYADIRHLSFFYVFEHYATVLENGISVGAAATLFYVLYEQFIRENSGLSVAEGMVSSLIERYVPSEVLEDAAKAVALAATMDGEEETVRAVRQTLAEFADENVGVQELEVVSDLIVRTLALLNAA